MLKKITKKFIVLLIFFFSHLSLSTAESIKNYEKGGLKLGKSLLEVMTLDEIIDGLNPITKGDDYIATMYIPNPFTYPDEIGLYLVVFDPEDEEFKIQGFYLFEDFPNDFEGCMKKQDQYVKTNSKLFNLKPVDYGIAPRPGGPGKWRAVIFEYPRKKETSSVLCYHFEEEPERNNLKMGVLTRKFADYISVRQ